MSRVAYFAYGSNMDTATLRGRRGIEWSRAAPALARGWRLVIDKPSLLGTGEAMATLVADPDAEVWGVLYEISTGDFQHLGLTEGVLIGHYQATPLLVDSTPAWDAVTFCSITATTFASDIRDSSLRPTTRYMRLLVSGAAEHGLPETWLDTLRRIEAVEESAEAAALRPYFDRAMKKPQ